MEQAGLRDGGPGRFKLASSAAPSGPAVRSHGASRVPVNLLSRHTRRILEQPDGWSTGPATAKAEYAGPQTHDGSSSYTARGGAGRPFDLPPGSLLLKSPRSETAHSPYGRREPAARTSEAIAEHYRTLLFSHQSPSPNDEAAPEAFGSSARQYSPLAGENFVYGASALEERLRGSDKAASAKRANPLLNKYRAHIVPKGMKRPPHTYAADDLGDAPFFAAGQSLYISSPVTHAPAPVIQPGRPASAQAAQRVDLSGLPHSQTLGAPAYFQVPSSGGGLSDNDELPPSLHEQKQRDLEEEQRKERLETNSTDATGYPKSKRGFSIECRIQHTPEVKPLLKGEDEGRKGGAGGSSRSLHSANPASDSAGNSVSSPRQPADDNSEGLGARDAEDSTEQDDEDGDREEDDVAAAARALDEEDGEDLDEGEEELEEEEEEYQEMSPQDGSDDNNDSHDNPDEDQVSNEGGDGRRGRGSDGALAAKYVQIISQLTDELGKAQNRIGELEQRIEDEQEELENELDDLDKGNLDLKGRTVALQRQVMHLTAERQENLVLMQDLEDRNEQLESDFAKMQEIATMLQTKAHILQQKVVKADKERAARAGAGVPSADAPRTLEEALARIADLEDANAALRANLKQQQQQQQQQQPRMPL